MFLFFSSLLKAYMFRIHVSSHLADFSIFTCDFLKIFLKIKDSFSLFSC